MDSRTACAPSRTERRHRPAQAATRVPANAPKQNSAMVLPNLVTPDQSKELAATPNRVVFPLMNDMNS